ncbi:hypothetical protein D3C74_430660 [compost metagenome]
MLMPKMMTASNAMAAMATPIQSRNRRGVPVSAGVVVSGSGVGVGDGDSVGEVVEDEGSDFASGSFSLPFSPPPNRFGRK